MAASGKKKGVAGTLFSMTGYGKAVVESDTVLLEIEIRSVNSRFLDIVCKLPRIYNEFEPLIREKIQQTLHRGRIEVYVQRSIRSAQSSGIGFQRAVFDQYMSLYQSLAEELGCWEASFKHQALANVLSRREVLDSVETLTDASESAAVFDGLTRALTHVSGMRAREGARLAEDLQQRVQSVRDVISAVQAAAPDTAVLFRTRLEDRLKPLAADGTLDPARIAQEAALMAERVDITEELVRLSSHCVQWEELLRTPPHGRKLEFLLQEMGREFNTIASKAQNSAIQALVVDAKATLEKMREQVANIE